MSKSRDTSAFEATYKTLNAEQKKAVDIIEGPVMVVAGPGTGKTQILPLRIANILRETQAKPENILAITFTDAGVKAMRQRLKSLIGEAAFDVRISTFHAFADNLIRQYPEAYEKIIGGRAASEIERIQLIETILTDTTFKAVRPSGDPAYYVQPLLRAIQTLKQENITPDTFSVAVSKQANALLDIEQYHEKGAHKGKERGEYKDAVKKLERNQELLTVYKRYEQLMREQNWYDFDDMILETVVALEKNEDMLRDLQEQYQYVLADEHQDVNGAQNRILELLVHFHDAPNIFVVGDEKQAIYRFQGASLENFLYFETAFPEAVTISLTKNYRSGQSILDSSQSVIASEDESLRQLRIPLTAAAVDSAIVEVSSLPHVSMEQSWIISEIEKQLAQDIQANEIAIIVRTNKEVEQYTTALRKKGIAVAPSADSDILEHPLLHSVETLISSAVNPLDDAVITQLLHEPYWDIEPKDISKIFTSATRNTKISAILHDPAQLDVADVNVDSPVRSIIPLLQGIKKRTLTTAPHRLVEMLLVESGLVTHVLQSDPQEGVRVLRRLYDEIEAMVERKEVSSLRDVLRQIQLHKQYGVSLPAPYISYGEAAVQVTTAHKAKGLEYEIVYVPNMTDSNWGGKRQRQLFDLPILRYNTNQLPELEEDERRLFYVAMTRAKGKLVLTSAETNSTGRELVPSRFLDLIPIELITEIDTTNFVKEFSPLDSLMGVLPVPAAHEIMLQVLSERGLSPTALNNYLKSPWEYFFKNVLRVPQAKTTELQFGTAVHEVLELLVRHHSADSVDAWLSLVPALFTNVLNKMALTDEEYTRLHERGCAALATYIPHLKNNASSEAKTEYQVEAFLETGLDTLPEIRITGNLDRIDNKNGVITQVVDYKTGKPKTRATIEGKTQASNGEYKRQLVFYALLLSLQKNEDKHCQTGVISFVEPDTHGVIKEEVFEIIEEEIITLRNDIVRVVQEIVENRALLGGCDETVCNYCHLVPAWTQ